MNIDSACKAFQKIYSNLQKGIEFYSKFDERMKALLQTVTEYVEFRTKEKNETENKIANSYAPPNAYPPSSAYRYPPPPQRQNPYQQPPAYNNPRPYYSQQYPNSAYPPPRSNYYSGSQGY